MSESKDTPNLDELTQLSRLLSGFLADPQPGLSTWRVALDDTLMKIMPFCPGYREPIDGDGSLMVTVRHAWTDWEKKNGLQKSGVGYWAVMFTEEYTTKLREKIKSLEEKLEEKEKKENEQKNDATHHP